MANGDESILRFAVVILINFLFPYCFLETFHQKLNSSFQRTEQTFLNWAAKPAEGCVALKLGPYVSV